VEAQEEQIIILITDILIPTRGRTFLQATIARPDTTPLVLTVLIMLQMPALRQGALKFLQATIAPRVITPMAAVVLQQVEATVAALPMQVTIGVQVKHLVVPMEVTAEAAINPHLFKNHESRL
jgi:hypothetical protein